MFLLDVFWHSESFIFTNQLMLFFFSFLQYLQRFAWNSLDRQLTGNIINMTSCLPFELAVRAYYLPFRLLVCLFQYLCRPSVSLLLKYVSSLPGCCPAVCYLILSLITSCTAIGELISWDFDLWLFSFFFLTCHRLLSPDPQRRRIPNEQRLS